MGSLRSILVRVGQRLAPSPTCVARILGRRNWIKPEYGDLDYHRSRYTRTGKLRMEAIADDQRQARRTDSGRDDSDDDDGGQESDILQEVDDG